MANGKSAFSLLLSGFGFAPSDRGFSSISTISTFFYCSLLCERIISIIRSWYWLAVARPSEAKKTMFRGILTGDFGPSGNRRARMKSLTAFCQGSIDHDANFEVCHEREKKQRSKLSTEQKWKKDIISCLEYPCLLATERSFSCHYEKRIVIGRLQ